MEQSPMDMRELADYLNGRGEPVIFLGDGVSVYRSLIEEEMKIPYEFAPAANNRQRGASVAALGMEYYKKGMTVDAAQFAPDYLRKSQAEREREEKDGQADV